VGHYVSQLTDPIQSQEYSRDSGNGGTPHRAWAVNANWNPNYGDWNVNVNSVANLNEWNAGNLVLSQLYSFKTPASTGILFVSASHRAFCLFHSDYLITLHISLYQVFLLPMQFVI